MNIAEFLEYLFTPAAQIALIIGLAEIIKRSGCPKKWIPLVDLALGLLFGVLVDGIMLQHGALNGVIVGIGLGLSSCGLFSGVKNLAERKSDEDFTDDAENEDEETEQDERDNRWEDEQ